MGKDAAALLSSFQARLAEVARELGREIYPDGLPRGTKFSELEEIAGVLGDEVARQLVESQVRQQANDWPEEDADQCPSCGGKARKQPDELRQLQTTRGDVSWDEHASTCPQCRRAFFPSEPVSGA